LGVAGPELSNRRPAQNRARFWSVDAVHLASDSEHRACVLKADAGRKLPETSLGCGHFGITPATVRPSVSLVVHHSRRLAVERTSRKGRRRCQKETPRRLRATAQNSTRGRCLRGGGEYGPPLLPSLSKVIHTLHLNTGARQCTPAPGHRGHVVVIPATPCRGDPGCNHRKRASSAQGHGGLAGNDQLRSVATLPPRFGSRLCAMIPWRLVEVFVAELGPVERLNRPSRAVFAMGAQSGRGRFECEEDRSLASVRS